jgi:hypothetical protein
MDIDLYPAKMAEQGLPNYFTLTFEANLSGRLKKKDAYWAAINAGMQVDIEEDNKLRFYCNPASESHRFVRDRLQGKKTVSKADANRKRSLAMRKLHQAGMATA